YEDLCLRFVEQLRGHRRELRGVPPFDPTPSQRLSHQTVEYRRIGHDCRSMVLEAGGNIGRGGDRMERYWGIRPDGEAPLLEIYGDDGLTAVLRIDPSDRTLWRGQ